MSTTPRLNATADTRDFAAVHRSIRLAGHAIAIAAETLRHDDHIRIGAFVRHWRGHVGEILSHHGVEDEIFFPALRQRVPDVGAVLDELDAQHHQLDHVLEACSNSIEQVVAGADPGDAAGALRRLADVMDHHLDLEDDKIVPAFERCFSSVEYERLTKAAIKHVGVGRQAAFTVPYIGYWATEEDRRALLDAAPLPFRVLDRLTRRRHARLTERALGADAISRARSRVIGAI